MKQLNLTVLLAEGPIGRAYLARMKQAGLAAKQIVLLVWKRHPTSKKPLGRWLPGSLRRAYASRYQEGAYNYWPRRIAETRPELVASMRSGMSEVCAGADRLIAEMLGPFDYAAHAERFDSLLVEGLGDRALARLLSQSAAPTVLYTGGGIVPASLLRLPKQRFVHIHPGFLPHVRGADGILWSTLVRGRPGASCFYMAEGIDTGDLVEAQELPPLSFSLPPGDEPDDQTLYRAVFSFCDPLVRAELLAGVLARADTDLSALPVRSQDLGAGVTYHFMHPRLRHAALRRLFRRPIPPGERR